LETKKEYREKVKVKLAELEPKVWMVKHRAEEIEGETRVEYNELFRVLHTKLEHIQQSMEELEAAGDEAWQDLRVRVDGALSDLNNSVGNVLARMH
jgi:hypothetical protein